MSRTVRDSLGEYQFTSPAATADSADALAFFHHAEAVRFLSRFTNDPINLATLHDLPGVAGSGQIGGVDHLVDVVAWRLVSGEIQLVRVAAAQDALSYAGAPSAVGEPAEDPSRAARRRFAAASGPPAEEEEEEEECACSVSELSIQCDHGGRKAGASGVLQVVAGRAVTDSHEIEWGIATAKLKLAHDGEDPVTVALSLADAETDDCGEISVARRASQRDWKSGGSRKFAVPGFPKAKQELWPNKAKPTKYYVVGRGHDGAESKLVVEAFPEHRRTVDVSLKAFADWVELVNKAWEGWAKTVFSLSPVEVELKLTGPKGSFSATWGWQEDSDWEAYFGFEAELGLKPILGVDIKFKVSVMKIAASAAGIPPPLPDLLAKHVADIFFYAGGGCKASLTGSPKGKFFPSGKRQVSGKGTFQPSGHVSFGVVARAGSDYIVSIALKLEGKSTITGEVPLEVTSDGLFVEPEIKLNPFVATCSVKLKALKVYSRQKTKKWEPWKKEFELYKGKRRQLLPR